MSKKLLILWLVTTCILYTWCTTKKSSVDNTTISSPTNEITIFALGDSITAWYQLPEDQARPAQLEALLHNKWYKQYKVVNAGKSWDTSQQLKDRLARSTSDAKKWDIAIVTIWGNDGFQSVPVETLKNNLRDIVTELQNKWLTVVIWWMQITTNLWQQYIREFKKLYPDIAKQTDATLIPFILEWVAMNPSLNLADMIHPNQQWYAIMADTVYQHLLNTSLITK